MKWLLKNKNKFTQAINARETRFTENISENHERNIKGFIIEKNAGSSKFEDKHVQKSLVSHSINRQVIGKRILQMVMLMLLCISAQIKSTAQKPLFRSFEALPKTSNGRVNIFEQDSLGYLWLGTSDGIYRFDGLHHRQIPLPDSLKTKKATSMCIHGNNVFIGLESGSVIQIDAIKKEVTNATHFTSAAITSLYFHEANTLWVGTNGAGIFTLKDGKAQQYSVAQGLADAYVHDILIVANFVAIATDLGLSLCRLEGDNVRIMNFNTSDGLTDNLITSLCINGEQNLVLGMQNGSMCNINLSNYRVNEFKSFNNTNSSPIIKILSLLENLLVITESGDAYITTWSDLNSVQKFDLEPDLKIKKMVTDALVDQEGHLMICFGTNKLYISDFRLQFIRDHDGVNFANAHAVLGDRNGNIWFSNEDGIFRHAGEFSNAQLVKKYFQSPESMNDIVSLCEDQNHNIWFGTFGNGLGYIDLNSEKTRIFSEKDGLVNNNILSIARQKELLWLATLGGACSVDISGTQPKFTTFDATSDLASNYVYSVFVDSNDEVWFGTDGNGLVKNDNGNFKILISDFPEMGKSVISIAQDKKNRIWYVSTDKGLQYFDGKSISDFKFKSGTIQTEIFSISSDAFGNIIALTSEGLALIQHETMHVTLLKTGFDVTTNYINTASQDAQGRVWLASTEAMIRYSDYQIGRKLKPRTIIESVEVMLMPIDSSIHEYESEQHHIAFNVASIWFQDPTAPVFQYKLLGYDIDWVTTRDNKIIFSQLSPGNYTFIIRSSVDEDWEHAISESYSFTILLPWWKTLWFMLLVVSIVVLLAIMMIKIRLNNIRKKELAAREKVQSQFDTLRNQINPHFLFNSFNTLNSIILSDQNAATIYVEKLSDYFRIVLEQREKDVITLKEELDLVENYLYLQKQRFGDNLSFSTALSSDTLKSLIPPMSLQLLAENAVKHNVISRNKPLHISIREEEGYLVIENNVHVKITKEPSTGIGLDNIRLRYRILFQKTIDQTATTEYFTVKLPIVHKLD